MARRPRTAGALKLTLLNWNNAAERLRWTAAEAPPSQLNPGQRDSLRALADRLPRHGVVIADEVGMGKTRIAVAAAEAVVHAGGRVAILIPPSLGYQWRDELMDGGIRNVPLVLRSLRTFLSAWSDEEAQRPWFNESVVLVSHGLANWRLGPNSARWRFELLPILTGLARRKASGRAPHGFRDAYDDADDWVRRAAAAIATHCGSTRDPATRRAFGALRDTTDWRRANDGVNYHSNAELREPLQQAVGLGLGGFDLVIIDEAHKSRDDESGLSRLLDRTLLLRQGGRRLCMTATPVELSAHDWRGMLARIQLDEPRQGQILHAVQRYTEAVRRVRFAWRSSAEARQSYIEAASGLQAALGPYVLRRDKRDDEAVVKFRQAEALGGKGEAAISNVESYRWYRSITVEAAKLNPEWRAAICAAEALSFAASGVDNPIAKRLRLTVGNGHGVASLVDAIRRTKEDDQRGEGDLHLDSDSEIPSAAERAVPTSSSEAKRVHRVEWWSRVLQRAVPGGDGLYDHPHIRAAIDAIEAYNAMGEKVLVFGRFTAPMRALTELLNARAMLRAIDAREPWPQRFVSVGDRAAVETAHRQLRRVGLFDGDAVDRKLAEQYKIEDARRERLQRGLLDKIFNGLDARQWDIRALAEAARDDGEQPAALLATAIDQLLGSGRRDARDMSDTAIAEAFASLVTALRERGEGDINGNQKLSAPEASNLWRVLLSRLEEEYQPTRGRFARLMIGATPQATRRTLQLAFNRAQSNPRVLVAQSVVGREGLNLHEACRVVVLLHPEWNPGVVEQQIGRVDRVGSRWAQMLEDAIAAGGDLPRIEVRPVIFEGTYDSHHWNVLLERWDDLRAQLHGVVVPHRLWQGCSEAEREYIRDLEAAAPSFTPPQTGASNSLTTSATIPS